jgi:hypothetical protein
MTPMKIGKRIYWLADGVLFASWEAALEYLRGK